MADRTMATSLAGTAGSDQGGPDGPGQLMRIVAMPRPVGRNRPATGTTASTNSAAAAVGRAQAGITAVVAGQARPTNAVVTNATMTAGRKPPASGGAAAG